MDACSPCFSRCCLHTLRMSQAATLQPGEHLRWLCGQHQVFLGASWSRPSHDAAPDACTQLRLVRPHAMLQERLRQLRAGGAAACAASENMRKLA